MNHLIAVLYEITLWIAALIAAPKFIYQLIVHKKYRTNFRNRLGLDYPIFDQSRPLIWVHAVSMGETKAIVSLSRELKRQYPQAQLVVSSITETGHREAKRALPFADYHVYLPFDFACITSRIIEKAKPALVVLCETDFWYNFLRFAKKQGAAIALVSGKLSEKSMARFQQLSFFSKPLFNLFNAFCLQNALYRERFLAIGIPENQLHVTGNLKFDDEYPHLSLEETGLWRQRLGIKPDQLVLTIGSTHNPEEQTIIAILKEIWKKNLALKVLLVPRHPERFKEVAALLEKERVRYITYTEINRRTEQEQIILIDAMGMLRMCYQLSDLAFVGGSLTSRVGGHNILEPCWYGKPVVFGPHMHTQMELVNFIKQYQAGFQVKDEQNLKELLMDLVENPMERRYVGERGLQLIQDLKGSTKKTLEALAPLLGTLKIKKK